MKIPIGFLKEGDKFKYGDLKFIKIHTYTDSTVHSVCIDKNYSDQHLCIDVRTLVEIELS